MASDPFVGEISFVGFSFPPMGWLVCDGSLLPKDQTEYQALFSLIGTTFGGDGVSTFGLPDLRGRLPLGTGQGPGLSPVKAGDLRGAEKTPLTVDHLPAHTHEARFAGDGVRPSAYNGGSSTTNPVDAVLANPMGEGGVMLPGFAPASWANAGLAALPVTGQVTVFPSGSGLPLNVCNPALGLNFIIAYLGVYPTRT